MKSIGAQPFSVIRVTSANTRLRISNDLQPESVFKGWRAANHLSLTFLKDIGAAPHPLGRPLQHVIQAATGSRLGRPI